jgi:hypothetical protein
VTGALKTLQRHQIDPAIGQRAGSGERYDADRMAATGIARQVLLVKANPLSDVKQSEGLVADDGAANDQGPGATVRF